MNLWENSEGSPALLGATWVAAEQAWNFALYSQHASRVTLLLFSAENLMRPVFTYEFDPYRNKTGVVWHARVPARRAEEACYYAYSLDGTGGGSHASGFHPEKLLLDPYANQIFFPPSYERSLACGAGRNTGKALLGVLDWEKTRFDWGKDSRTRHDHDLIIYEMHVRGFTMNPNSRVVPERRGTFAGVVEKIPYLRELGITAVELMPVFEFDDTEPNYWGYMPINFFAPHAHYATHNGDRCAVRECKAMVKALHEAGIEVILDVVYNHTGEGNESGPTLSFRGIDDPSYYIHSRDPHHPYADFTGVGNTLNCANPAVRRLIVESLRYWVREMHVDGFRFDLASVFSRDSSGAVNFDEPAIFGDIASDPDLARVRLIAEPWEGNGQYPNYELGSSPVVTGAAAEACCQKPACACPPTPVILQRSFPGMGWRQWNDKFRNTLRRFVKGDAGFVGDLMTRIYGSSDVFPDSPERAYRAYQSVNYVASHDGPTLYDLVAYTSEDSWNCGEIDGEAGISKEVLQLRKKQVKNFFCLLMLANGTPMLRAGDEFLQTQYGQRNPYDIDSPLTWLDWHRLNAHRDVFRFFQRMIDFRKRHTSIARSVFWRNDIRWYGVGPDVDWSQESRSLAYCLHGASVNDADIYVMINGFWEPLAFDIQEGNASDWIRVIDTDCPNPEDFLDPGSARVLNSLRWVVQPRSIVVLEGTAVDGSAGQYRQRAGRSRKG